MAVVVTPSTPVDTLPKRPNALWQFIKTQPLGLVGFLIIALYVVCAFGANWISPFDPEAIDFAPARFPGTFAMLASALVLPWNEGYRPEHVDHIAQSIGAALDTLAAA